MKKLLPLFVLLSSAALATAATPSALHYQTGQISLLGGKATLNTGTNLRYLDAEDAKKVIMDLWGNPPESATDVQGMILPAGAGLGSADSWGVVISEDHEGHVSDKDEASLNYDKVLREMQKGAQERNAEREKAGYDTVDLVGWADTPHYDDATHKMYWAKALDFHSKGNAETTHTLNYAVRVLGRDNVMELNAVAGMEQLPQVKQDMQAVLQQVNFNPGRRYEDFNARTDKLAAYGIAGLLGVAAAKKVGLLAGGFLLLKKGGVLLLAALGSLRRLFRRRAA